jgi:hypothetical protein
MGWLLLGLGMILGAIIRELFLVHFQENLLCYRDWLKAGKPKPYYDFINKWLDERDK